MNYRHAVLDGPARALVRRGELRREGCLPPLYRAEIGGKNVLGRTRRERVLMTEVEIAGDSLIVRVKGLHKLWAFKSGLEIPLGHVAGAAPYRDVALEPGAIRVLGTGFPGVISAGLYRRKGEWEFWDVMDEGKVIVVELTDERYSRLVVEVADPDSAVGAIRRALRSG